MQAPKLVKLGHKNCFNKCFQIAGSITSPQQKISLISEFLLEGKFCLI